MSTISWQEFERDPVGLLSRVEAGEAILVTRGAAAVAELRPVATIPPVPRPFGLAAGQFVTPADFDTPLPDAVVQEFEAS
jgi:antitoxin (DNA-binding transcriptional repressor) of toxin-antitoxin stability system